MSLFQLAQPSHCKCSRALHDPATSALEKVAVQVEDPEIKRHRQPSNWINFGYIHIVRYICIYI